MATGGQLRLAGATLRDWCLKRLKPPSAQQAEEARDRKKPTNLVFDVDEVPPLLMRLGISLQHLFLMSIGWLYVVVIVNSVGGSDAQAASLIRMSMIAGGMATILQASQTVIGSGYLCPLSGSLTYLQPSILAARTGGFSLLFGMIAVSGVATSLFSRVTSRLRVLFPPEVTGLMVTMSGLQLVALGCPRFAGMNAPGAAPEFRAVVVGFVTLLVMVAATVWHRGRLHILPMLIGLCVGFVMAVGLGVLPWHQFLHEFDEPWISLPRRASAGISFQFALLIPFLISCLTANLKTVGDITLCQKINDAEWKRTDMQSVSGGLLANGVGTILSGMAGGVAQNTVSSSIGLSLATGTTSRSIALPTGLLVIGLAFFPRLSAVFAAMPMPVMGAMLIYSACFIVVGGLQLLTSRMLDARRIFVVGISLIFGLSVEIAPEMYRLAPNILRPIVSSSTSLATVLVVLLSMFFRMGVSKRRSFVFHPGTDSVEEVHSVMEEQGALWGMRREVEMRAEHAIHETIASVVSLNPFLRQVDVTIQFDELKLEAEIAYNGASPVLPDTAPSPEELATDAGIAALSGYMIRQFADRVRIKERGVSSCKIQLQFHH